MTLDVVVDGRAARLTLEEARFRYQREDGETVDGEFSLVAAGPGAYSVIVEGRGFLVSLPQAGQVYVNGRRLPVEVFDPREMRERSSGGVSQGRQNVAAPMPGKVIRLLVQPGDQVESGQGLVVVEAMKMQNEMKSPKAGRVAEVRTRAGLTVEGGR